MRRLLPPIAVLMLLAAPALAGRGKPCSDCQSCTEMLAKPGVEVALSQPITNPPSTCVVITGEGSTFDGGRHLISGASVAVRIDADDAWVRHVRAEGGQKAVEVKGARATLLDVQTTNVAEGVRVSAAPGVRIVRSTFVGGRVGVAFGPSTGDTCRPDARLSSPGAVLQRVEINGAQVGVAACEAVPVLSSTQLLGNGIGLLQGAAPPAAGLSGPAAKGAHDPCACAASLPGAQAATTHFFTSGCSGSMVHEDFMPEVTGRGYDVIQRKHDPASKAEREAFDRYIRRCAPEVMDAIGIPGCMPNYACVANGEVSKRRGDDDRLVVDHRLSGVDDVSAFAARCVAAAEAQFADGGACPAAAVRDSVICQNQRDVVSARAIAGADNRCGSASGAGSTLGCASCDGVERPAPPPAPTAKPTPAAAPDTTRRPPSPTEAAAPNRPAAPAPQAQAPTAAPQVQAPTAPAAAPSAPAAAAAPSGEPTAAPGPDDEPQPAVPGWALAGILLLGGGVGVAFARRR